jgi:hypothetical protein
VNTVVDLQVPYNIGKYLSSWATGGVSRRIQLHGVSYFWEKYTIKSSLQRRQLLVLGKWRWSSGQPPLGHYWFLCKSSFICHPSIRWCDVQIGLLTKSWSNQ